MIASDFSFVIPVYNRPEEVRELLESFCELEVPKTFEIVIVEDGSGLDAAMKKLTSLSLMGTTKIYKLFNFYVVN